MNPSGSPVSRRQFLHRSALAAGALALPTILPGRLFGQSAPSKKVTIGFIGTGNIAGAHLDTLLGYDDARIVAVCDVDQVHRDAAKTKVDTAYGDTGCTAYRDFRELVARPDIDAVWVCTPDHWHALAAIWAMRHGKDVYVEKPLTLTIREGRALVETAAQHGRIVQTGLQQRSSKRFHDAAAFIRNGGLGKLERIEVLIPANNKHVDATWTPEPVPETLDWDLWLGPAPWRPFHRHACHYNFRFILDHAAGQVTNWGTHYIDIAQWALGMDDAGPTAFEGHGEFPDSGLFTAATKVDFTCWYPSGVSLRCHTRHDGEFDGNVRFHGERGWLDVSRSHLTASAPELVKEATARKGSVKLRVSTNHHDDFLTAVRTRQQPIATAEIGHRTTTVCNLGNIAMLLGRRLQWDPTREAFVNDDIANRLRHYAMRSPWGLV